jgi:hypothetical protein
MIRAPSRPKRLGSEMASVLIGMETSGALRRRFQDRGHCVISIDVLPAEDGAGPPDLAGIGGHVEGDVFAELERLWGRGWWPDLGIFHPTCTYLTNAAEWAYSDPDFDRYPGVGYHQRLKAGTLFGEERRAARERALDDVRRIMALPIRRKAIENPKGAIGSRIMRPSQSIQPHQFGDDASKGTCLWLWELPRLRPTKAAPPRIVDDGRAQLGLFGTGVERWGNQTDSGQNNLRPGEDRWKERSRTFPGVAEAIADQWGSII